MGRTRVVVFKGRQCGKSTDFTRLLKVHYFTPVQSWFNHPFPSICGGVVDKEQYVESYRLFPDIADSFSPSVGGK